MQSDDALPRYSETLQHILLLLETEKLFGAREALINEIKERYPAGSSPTASSEHAVYFAPPSGHQHAEGFDFNANVPDGGQTADAQESEQARLRSQPSQEPSEASTSSPPLSQGIAGSYSPRHPAGAGDADEYSDDEDVGYVREYVRGQAHFERMELHLSDDDASQRGLDLYHQAQQNRGQSLGHEEGDGGSSDGHGSSYFSGELLERGTSVKSQPSNASHELAGESDRVVTILEPVNPMSPPPSAVYVVSPSPPPRSPVPATPPSPTSHPLRMPSFDSPEESPGKRLLESEPSMSPGLSLPLGPELEEEPAVEEEDIKPTLPEQGGQEGAGTWANHWGPLGMLGKVTSVFAGRKPDSPAARPGGKGSRSGSVVDVRAETREPSIARATIDVDDGVPAAPMLEEQPAIPEAAPAAGEPRDAPQTPGGRAAPDSAFSFPVTPPPEPVAVDAVFSAWPANRGKASHGKGSGYNSEYNTDDESSEGHSIWGSSQMLSSRQNSMSPSTMQLGMHEAMLQEVQELGIVGKTVRPLGQGAPLGGSQAPPVHPEQAVGARRKAGLSISPLDLSVSLPKIHHLDSAERPADSMAPPEATGTTSGFGLAPEEARPGQLQGIAEETTSQRNSLEREEAWPKDCSEAPTAASMDPLHSEYPDANAMPKSQGALAAPCVPSDEGSSPEAAASAGAAETSEGLWNAEAFEQSYEVLQLTIVHRRHCTGFEESKDLSLHVNDLIAGRYEVREFLGSAAFSRAVQAYDIKNDMLVCLKIIKNNKDYFDQSLDEIKLLKYVNERDANDEHGILRLYDYFYYKEHLFLVCELLRANLYEFQKYNREHPQEQAPYFTLGHVQLIATQVLQSLAFMHSLDLIHCDLKPENILVKSFRNCEVKVIDLGSSCFTTDHLSSYMQSRSYRAPEVILGLPYDQKIDLWSLGCILAELLSGQVLFQNDSLATLLARLEGILGPVPERMLTCGRYTHHYYTRRGVLYERSPRSQRYELLRPKRTSLAARVPKADPACVSFLEALLSIDPDCRPTAEEALLHPWLTQMQYPPFDPSYRELLD